MITLVEALNFRCLRDVSRRMGNLHVLVGPNASGKSTFLDAIGFLSDLVKEGLHTAIDRRSPTFHDLLYRQEGTRFELAVEASLPEELRESTTGDRYDSIRYEVVIGLDQESQQIRFNHEGLRVLASPTVAPRERSLFPDAQLQRPTLVQPSRNRSVARTVVTRTSVGRANYYSETYRETGKGWNPQWDLAPTATALANLPADVAKFPVSTWFREFLVKGIESIQLDSMAMRQPSPPGQGLNFKRDGSNLPWVIDAFQRRDPNGFRDWIAHVATALPELADVRTVERAEDRKRYLKVCYAGGLEVPSWLVSDGTLRLLALTLPAYLNNLGGVLLIEEPENGIHPRAVEMLFEALSQVHNAQVLVATHSPVILSIVDASQVLCLAKDDQGATDIISGDEHPRLQDWQHDVPLGELFAAGVLS